MIKNGIKRLPIIEDGKLVGMVTFTDLLRVYPDITKSFEIDVEKLPKKYKKWLRR
jgi:CBS domain-containing protein